MKFNPNEDFSKNIGKLLSLLKRMLSRQKVEGKELNEFFNNKNVNLNLCFFTFMPLPFDEMEDMEGMDEMMDEAFAQQENREEEMVELKFELNNHDLDFLKENGLKF